MIKWVILAIVLILVIVVIAMYNGFIRLRNQCEEAFATMDVYLKKRYDLIPNLVETVKGYASHEKETLEKVIAARNTAQGAGHFGRKDFGRKCIAKYVKELVCCCRKLSGSKSEHQLFGPSESIKSR